MKITLTAESRAFLWEAERLGQEGRTQEEIAKAMGLSLNALRYRLNGLGFDFIRRTVVATKPQFGGRSLAELEEAGDVIVAPAGDAATEPEGAVA